ncbi:MAG: bifunctional homocysteine S-methyltransferase/methylenetetrahydrofolate reductase [Planctomycetes bacterium GWF2_41_51]|nr:MAG: bifunctional homocysteine S-methyltransferase/methylenetetrahydrofolate reductase [Planctomycetes bacterium GWF2_41_51]
MTKTLTELLSRQIVFGDGAMGTMLYAKGVFINTCFEELNIANPRLVGQIHDLYIAAGSDFIETNTYGANEIKLARFGYAEKTAQINEAAVKIAKQSADQSRDSQRSNPVDNGAGILVAGSIGPLGINIAQGGFITEKDISNAFTNQIKAIASAGADFLLFETFHNLKELLIAINCAINNCDLEIVAQMAINEQNETLYGDKIEYALAEISEFPQVAAVGLNCSIGPAAMLDALPIIKKATSKPISLQPNAGLPQNIDGRTVYMCTPEYMAEYAKRFYEKGVKIIGGCCGTTPDHIRQMTKTVRPLHKADLSSAVIEIKPQPKQVVAQKPVALKDKSKFGAKLASGEKIYTVEISPPKGTDVSNLIEKVKLCEKFGIDAVNIPDGPRASSRLSAMITAIKIKQSCNIETILHICCRDRNIIAMQSDLLGIQAVDIANVLIITGDPPKLGEYPDATAVFDLDSIALTKVVSNLNCGIDIAGNALPLRTSLVAGVGANPVASDLDREILRYKKKVEAGAEFAITQPVFDEKSLFKFLELTKNCKIPVIAGIWPFTSYKNAEFMANEVPGVVVPPEILQRMSKTKDQQDGKKMGVEIAIELMEKIKNAVAGFAISAPFGNVNMALAAAGKIGLEKI